MKGPTSPNPIKERRFIPRMNRGGFPARFSVSEFLGYITWAAFQGTIKRAIRVAHDGGWNIREHFQPAYKVVVIGARSYRSIDDYQLSREAFWLIVQNADPSKITVSFGKTVLALQAAIHHSPKRPQGWEHLPDGIGGWSKSFGTFKPVERVPELLLLPPEPSIKPLLDERQRKRKKSQKQISGKGQPDLFSEGQ